MSPELANFFKGYRSSWIFGPRLSCANALRRVQHPAFSLVTSGAGSDDIAHGVVELGRHRWKVERSLSWLSCFRRLQVRWDRDAGRWFAFVLVACAVVCFNRL